MGLPPLENNSANSSTLYIQLTISERDISTSKKHGHINYKKLMVITNQERSKYNYSIPKDISILKYILIPKTIPLKLFGHICKKILLYLCVYIFEKDTEDPDPDFMVLLPLTNPGCWTKDNVHWRLSSISNRPSSLHHDSWTGNHMPPSPRLSKAVKWGLPKSP